MHHLNSRSNNYDNDILNRLDECSVIHGISPDTHMDDLLELHHMVLLEVCLEVHHEALLISNPTVACGRVGTST